LNEKYILIYCFERAFDAPILFESLEKARAAMKKSIIAAMDGLNESVFNDYKIDEDYFWQPDGNSAWFTYRHGNSDWQIYALSEFLHGSAIPDENTTGESSDEPKSHPLLVALTAEIKPEDIDDIMCAALEGGITYWCSKAEVVGEYLSKYAHEQISKDGKLILHDSEDNKQHELTREKFLKGLRLFLDGCPNLINGEDKSIDPGDFDANYADAIIQLALFGEVVYS
jgi:hypothetical protein